MTTRNNDKPRRRMAREAGTCAQQSSEVALTKAPSKLDRVEALLRGAAGASLAEIMAETGWQQHSVRGAMAGALRKRGLVITSDMIDGVRRYRAQGA